jgi:hypothetical protein
MALITEYRTILQDFNRCDPLRLTWMLKDFLARSKNLDKTLIGSEGFSLVSTAHQP